MLTFSEIFEFSRVKIPILKEFEWFEWFERFEWFGPSPIEPFNPGMFQLRLVRWSFRAWHALGAPSQLDAVAGRFIGRKQAFFLLRRIVLRWRSWASSCLLLREARFEREEQQALQTLNRERGRMGESLPGLKGSIGEGSNHSNFSQQSSVEILSKFRNFR